MTTDEATNTDRPQAVGVQVEPIVMCGFHKAWVGKCKTQVLREGDKCDEHQIKCRSCSAPATHQCAETGQFVCGAPLCDDCTHNIHPQGYNGGIGFNALPLPEGMKTHGKKAEQRYAPWYVNTDNIADWRKANGIPDYLEVALTGDT